MKIRPQKKRINNSSQIIENSNKIGNSWYCLICIDNFSGVAYDEENIGGGWIDGASSPASRMFAVKPN